MVKNTIGKASRWSLSAVVRMVQSPRWILIDSKIANRYPSRKSVMDIIILYVHAIMNDRYQEYYTISFDKRVREHILPSPVMVNTVRK